ncbi:MAG: helix-turn-helix transcriptional regulator [Alphaproteobacteria bacterium]|nr:helix-turn-helix transcriptional regulator [Alphaproteobacteria bacterium]
MYSISLGIVTNILFFPGILKGMIVKEQIKAARAMLDMKQSELAEKAGVSLATLNNIERGADSRVSTLKKIRAALENEGVEFTGERGGAPGLSLHLKRHSGDKL